MPQPDKTDKTQVEDWPVLTIEFNQMTRHYCDMDPDDGFQHDPAKYTTYYPADAKNVLSPEEARLLVAMYDDEADVHWAEDLGAVINRLETYAKETEATDA